MSGHNSTRWRIKLRTHRKKNRVKRSCKSKVMYVLSLINGKNGSWAFAATIQQTCC
ncbi:hypothetical protein HanHA89_Chr09g0360161 [Helianthus annuus]|nr:hypothetical protein HanHA89_Chr09g0360161 [Helianthus annuus]